MNISQGPDSGHDGCGVSDCPARIPEILRSAAEPAPARCWIISTQEWKSLYKLQGSFARVKGDCGNT